MKKLMALLLSLVTVLSMTCVAFAGEMPTTSNTYPAEYEYFDDGSYIVTTITESSSILTRASGSKTASKTSKYYSSSGSALWSVTVTGSFSYTGSSAKCTSSSVSANSYSSLWKINSKSAVSYTHLDVYKRQLMRTGAYIVETAAPVLPLFNESLPFFLIRNSFKGSRVSLSIFKSA